MNGESYSVVGFSETGNPLLSRRNSSNQKQPLSLRLNITLDQNAKHKRIIKDQIYPDNQGMAKMTRVFVPLNICFAFCALICLLVFAFVVKQKYSFILLIGASAFALVTIVFFVLYLIFRHHLKLRRHLLD